MRYTLRSLIYDGERWISIPGLLGYLRSLDPGAGLVSLAELADHLERYSKDCDEDLEAGRVGRNRLRVAQDDAGDAADPVVPQQAAKLMLPPDTNKRTTNMRAPADVAATENQHLWASTRQLRRLGAPITAIGSFAELTVELDALNLGDFLVFGWEWVDARSRHDDLRFSGDVFKAHVMLLGSHHVYTLVCPIDKSQEDEVLVWLRGPRVLGLLKDMWTPILDDDTPPQVSAYPTANGLRPQQVNVLEDLRSIIDAHLQAARDGADPVAQPPSAVGHHPGRRPR